MGLQDRLSKPATNGATAVADFTAPAQATPRGERAPQSSGVVDPYAELKTRIHHAVIETVGVELFKQEMTEDLHDRVLRAVTEQLVLDRTPLTREERRQIVGDITDDILGYGPIEPLLRDDSISEVMVNAFDQIYCERSGKLERTNTAFVDNAHLMRIIDKIVSQVGRRVDEASPMVDARLPDGVARQRDHPAAGAEGPDAHDPEVLARPVHDERPDLVRVGLAEGGAVPRRVREGEAEHPHLRRNRHRQDDDAERDVGVRAGGRAHRHDRGRRRAPAPAGPRDHARVAPAEHRGPGRGAHPRARPQRPAHAARPDHRRRGPRRGDAGHAPGDEHGPRGLADDDPRELAA